MIRPATPKDIHALVDLGRRMHDESPHYSRLKYSPVKVGIMIERLIELENGFVWVGDRDGDIVGALLGICDEHWMSSERVATEIALYVAQDYRGAILATRLLTEFMTFATYQRAKLTVVGASSGLDNERVAAFYERFGFERVSIGLERGPYV